MEENIIDEDWGKDLLESELESNQYPDKEPLSFEGYTLHNLEDIENKINDVLEKIKELFGLTNDQSLILLKENRWNYENLEQIWFDNIDKLSIKCGIKLNPEAIEENKIFADSLGFRKAKWCPICYENLTKANSASLTCAHSFCKCCWKNYFLEALTEGRKCVYLRCPFHKCNLSIPPSMFRKYLNASEMKIYKKYLYKSYTDDNKSIRWCPNPGCSIFTENPSLSALDIRCKCGTVYCFKCGTESHLPVSCEQIIEWERKSVSESENITWIMANTKNCPKCKRCIEKNQGCNHMSCSQCLHQFCWVCMTEWSKHGQQTGGYYKCNVYDQIISNNPNIKEQERKAEHAKNQLQKYMFYFERYNNHKKGEKLALIEEVKIEDEIERFHSEKNYPIGELEFLREAIKTIVDCRRILKNSYIFGYYLINQKEKQLFQFIQQNLEVNADNLHEQIEMSKEQFLDITQLNRKPFYEYRSNLIDYATTTKSYYKHFLEGIEEGLTKE